MPRRLIFCFQGKAHCEKAEHRQQLDTFEVGIVVAKTAVVFQEQEHLVVVAKC